MNWNLKGLYCIKRCMHSSLIYKPGWELDKKGVLLERGTKLKLMAECWVSTWPLLIRMTYIDVCFCADNKRVPFILLDCIFCSSSCSFCIVRWQFCLSNSKISRSACRRNHSCFASLVRRLAIWNVSLIVKICLVSKSIAVLLHSKIFMWKVPILLHTEPIVQKINWHSVYYVRKILSA